MASNQQHGIPERPYFEQSHCQGPKGSYQDDTDDRKPKSGQDDKKKWNSDQKPSSGDDNKPSGMNAPKSFSLQWCAQMQGTPMGLSQKKCGEFELKLGDMKM